MTEIPSFLDILNTDITPSEAAQFLAEQQHARNVEWERKHGRNPMELFGNCK